MCCGYFVGRNATLAACLSTRSCRVFPESSIIHWISSGLGSPWLHICLLISSSLVLYMPKWLYSLKACLILFECAAFNVALINPRLSRTWRYRFWIRDLVQLVTMSNYSQVLLLLRPLSWYLLDCGLGDVQLVCVGMSFRDISLISFISLTDALPTEQFSLDGIPIHLSMLGVLLFVIEE